MFSWQNWFAITSPVSLCLQIDKVLYNTWWWVFLFVTGQWLMPNVIIRDIIYWSYPYQHCDIHEDAIPDSKVHGTNMGPIWGRQDPGGPHVGLMNFAIWDGMETHSALLALSQENPQTTCAFPLQRQSFDVSFDASLTKLMNKYLSCL